MKTNLLTAFLLITASVLFSQTSVDTLTNEQIVQLSKIGLQPSVIIGKIQTSVNKFDVSTNGLISLSKEGVSADVINEMMKYDTKTKTDIANQKDMRDPKTKRQTGIYYYNPVDSVKLFKRVDPTVIASNKSGGFGNTLARNSTGGIAKAKVTSTLAGPNSRLQIDETSPVFFFYFESSSNANGDNWFFATATSPNEFVLVALDKKKDSREMVVGSENIYGSTSGISDKVKVEFAYEEVIEGIYKVTFKKPLKKGEYCFMYASAAPTAYSNNKVFDFGISKEE